MKTSVDGRKKGRDKKARDADDRHEKEKKRKKKLKETKGRKWTRQVNRGGAERDRNPSRDWSSSRGVVRREGQFIEVSSKKREGRAEGELSISRLVNMNYRVAILFSLYIIKARGDAGLSESRFCRRWDSQRVAGEK